MYFYLMCNSVQRTLRWRLRKIMIRLINASNPHFLFALRHYNIATA